MDDAKIYQTVLSMAEVTKLQCVVNNSIDWSVLWKRFFNFKKCKHMHLGNHDMNQTYTMRNDQEELPIEKGIRERPGCYNGQQTNIYQLYILQNQDSNQEPWTYI